MPLPRKPARCKLPETCSSPTRPHPLPKGATCPDTTVASAKWLFRTARSSAGPSPPVTPFRLAAATDVSVQKIALLGKNEKHIGPDEDYLISLHPTFGINRYFVGGDVQEDGSVSYDRDCLTRTGQEAAPIVVFASSGSARDDGSVTEGFNHITPPNLTGPMWSSEKWSKDADPDDYGNIHARHGGEAVIGFLDGSVRLLGIPSLRDMRLWSAEADAENDPDYTVPRSGGGRL